MNWDEFIIASSSIGYALTEEQISAFHQYFSLLEEWNEKINLTALRTEAEIIEKHFFDSLLLAPVLRDRTSILDIGSGAGFPGIPLKIVLPEMEVILLEPTGKRARFLELVISKLKLKKIKVASDRAEYFVKNHREAFAEVTARAVAPLPILLELALPLTAVGGTFYALKAKETENEIAQSAKALDKLGGDIRKIHSFALPSGESRTIVEIHKIKSSPARYPRAYGEIKHRPLLS